MKTRPSIALLAATIASLPLLTPPARAAISTTGDVSPDPAATTADDDLSIADIADGSMTVDAGSTVNSNNAFIGHSPGVIGTVTITGENSAWSNTAALRVGGNRGAGTLNINAGGQVAADTIYLAWPTPGSTSETDIGSIFVDGAGSTLSINHLLIGDSSTFNSSIRATGQLTIRNGATASIGNSAVVYKGATLTVKDTDSEITLLSLVTSGGAVELLNAGTIAANQSTIGWRDRPGIIDTALLDGPGSTWTNTTVMVIGRDGDASLTIRNGGSLSSNGGSIAMFAPSTSEVLITGTNSLWTNTNNLWVANGGNATLTVADGGKVQTDSLTIGGFGLIRGNSEIQAASVDNSGSIAPGLSAGSLLITGNYTQQAAGTLAIELDHAVHDQLNVTGSASIAGNLTVDLLNGFAPNLGDAFTILTANTLAGTFDFTSPIFNGIYYFDAVYQSDAVVLEVLAHLLMGDANNDGIVDAADLLAVESNFGAVGIANGLLPGDANDDGRVDGADYLFVERHFGATLDAGLATPEPTTSAIVLLLLAGCITRTRKPQPSPR